MYLIWKIRCERVITWNNKPEKFHSHNEIHNKWLQAINVRLKMDSIRTNTKIFKAKAIKPKIVLKTWKNCLKEDVHDTRNWCGKMGVFVMDMVIFRTIFFELLVFFTFTILTIHFAC